MSPGWQSSARHIASSVDSLTALALPFFKIDKLAIVIPTCSLNSLSDILRRAIITSKFTTIIVSLFI